MRIQTHSPEETMRFGQELARHLKAGDILCLSGDLGSGKTTLVKGIAKGLKIKESDVISPTFVLMNIYDGRLPLYHFDFYRLDDIKEIAAIGCDEFLYGNGVAVIEWAERLGELMPEERLDVHLHYGNQSERVIALTPKGDRYKRLMQCL